MKKKNYILWGLELEKYQQKMFNFIVSFRKTKNKDIKIEIWHFLGDRLWNFRWLKKMII